MSRRTDDLPERGPHCTLITNCEFCGKKFSKYLPNGYTTDVERVCKTCELKKVDN